MNIKVSVLIPVFGVQNYIQKCAFSLFNNTIANECEFIFVNDCTKDKSIEILKNVTQNYPQLKIEILNHEINSGLATARNTALRHAHGEYIICVDSDDWVELNFLELLYKNAKENMSDMVTCNYYDEFTNKTIIKKQTFDYIDVYNDFLIDKVRGYVWCKLVKRSLFLEHDIKWVDGINMWEDILISSKTLFYSKNFSSVNVPLYHYRHNNLNSIVHSKEIKYFNDSFFALCEIKKLLVNENKYDSYRNALIYKYLSRKMAFVRKFKLSKKDLNKIITKQDKNFLKENIFMFSGLKRIFVILLCNNMYLLLFIFCRLGSLLIKEKLPKISKEEIAKVNFFNFNY